MAPLRILCLHGFTQNAKVFSSKTKAIQKGLRGIAEFSFAEGELLPNESDDDDREARCWWRSNDKPSKNYRGLDKTLLKLDSIFQKEGPFDGILGFSQGACLTIVLALLQDEREIIETCLGLKPQSTSSIKVRFAMGFSGFFPADVDFGKAVGLKTECTLPLFWCYGDNDSLITPERSKECVNSFKNVTLWSHPGKHYMPSNASAKEAYRKFLVTFIKENGDEKDELTKL